jgi:glycosyltransferase involved in cell wall biosynthesis
MEGFGWPALEALACGTPLVITDTSALAEHFASVAAIVLPTPVKDNMADWAAQSAEAVQVLLSLDPREKQTITADGLAHGATFTKEKFREGLVRGLALCE